MKTTTLALMTTILLSLPSAWSAQLPQSPVIASQMASAMTSLQSTFSSSQQKKASFAFDADEKEEWRYLPNPSLATSIFLPSHKGLAVGNMSQDQLAQVMDLLALGLTTEGLDAVVAARFLDSDNSLSYRGLRDWLMFQYSEKNYFLSVFGKPGDIQWAWRFEGHHISLTFHVNQLKNTVTLTPAFIGTTEAQVIMGAKTIEVLKPVVVSAKALASSLSSEQLKAARQSMSGVPKFNKFSSGLLGGKLKVERPLPAGASVKEMTEAQKKLVQQILADYRAQIRSEISNPNVEAVMNGQMDDLELVWSGDEKMEEEFYFRIQGEKFVFEFTCSEGSASHYHAVLLDI
jgi:hypothetical protein